MVTLDDIRNAIDSLKTKIEDAISSAKLRPQQITIVQGLSDISNSLGTIRAGEFLAMSTGDDPNAANGSGTFISALGRIFNSNVYHIGGANAGVLQWGGNSNNGRLEAGGGQVWLDADGIGIREGQASTLGGVNGISYYDENDYSGGGMYQYTQTNLAPGSYLEKTRVIEVVCFDPSITEYDNATIDLVAYGTNTNPYTGLIHKSPRIRLNTASDYIYFINAGLNLQGKIVFDDPANVLEVSQGGTGATDAATARLNLGITSGSGGALSYYIQSTNDPLIIYAYTQYMVYGKFILDNDCTIEADGMLIIL